MPENENVCTHEHCYIVTRGVGPYFVGYFVGLGRIFGCISMGGAGFGGVFPLVGPYFWAYLLGVVLCLILGILFSAIFSFLFTVYTICKLFLVGIQLNLVM